MTDHHDYGDHHFGDDHLPFDDHDQFEPHHDEPGLPDDDHLAWEPAAPDEHHVELPVHDDASFTEHAPQVGDHPAADVAGLPEVDLSDNVFPPAVDVGELPEPVDGFPWIDTGSLGLADIQQALHDTATDPVQPSELAEYAHTELPEAADGWQALADSDDPATAALAKWWSQQN